MKLGPRWDEHTQTKASLFFHNSRLIQPDKVKTHHPKSLEIFVSEGQKGNGRITETIQRIETAADRLKARGGMHGARTSCDFPGPRPASFVHCAQGGAARAAAGCAGSERPECRQAT